MESPFLYVVQGWLKSQGPYDTIILDYGATKLLNLNPEEIKNKRYGFLFLKVRAMQIEKRDKRVPKITEIGLTNSWKYRIWNPQLGNMQ